MATPRQYSLCKCVTDLVYVLGLDDHMFIYLGEMPNMEEHCVVAGYMSGKVYSGFHIDNFEEVNTNNDAEMTSLVSKQ